jgi:hypothetical protein
VLLTCGMPPVEQWSYYVVMYSILMISIDYAFIRFNVYQHMPDAEKVVIASVVIPLAFELLLTTPARYMIRTWRHHHESTSICLIALSMATTKGLSRLLISLVKDVNMVTLGSLLAGFAEFGSVSSVRLRDRLGYFFMGYALEDPQEAFATMRAHKNKFLRVRLAHLETQLEVTAAPRELRTCVPLWRGLDTPALARLATAHQILTCLTRAHNRSVRSHRVPGTVIVHNQLALLGLHHGHIHGQRGPVRKADGFGTLYQFLHPVWLRNCGRVHLHRLAHSNGLSADFGCGS